MRTVRSIVAGLFVMLIGSTAWGAACDGFVDVDDANTTYCTAVSLVKDRGITLGCSDASHYCPNDFVTRLQMALFLERAALADPTNQIGSPSDTVSGGQFNSSGTHLRGVPDPYRWNVVAGGNSNTATGASAVGGGYHNLATGLSSVIAGGDSNTASGDDAAVAGGATNTASGNLSAIGGGQLNVTSGAASAVIGGSGNTAAGILAVVVGGDNNAASGDNSIIFGHNGVTTFAAKGSVVFSDSTANGGNPYGSGAANEFLVAASGGIRMNTAKDYTTGCRIPAGGGAWQCVSSRDIKRDFSAVNTADILAKVTELPVMRWRYQNEPSEVRHIGTFSQDFRAAFGLGDDDKSISTVDADGIALAAIQGLNAKLEADQALIGQQSRALADQAHELAEIKAQLAGLVAAH